MDNKEYILAKWLSGEISDAELVAIEGEAVLKDLKRVKKEVDQWSLPSYDTDAGYQKMKNRIQKKTATQNSSQWPKVVAIIAAIGILALGLFTWLGNKGEVLKAPPGQRINFAFQDGSEVWLNDGSRIHYNTKDWSSRRAIALEGEALFEVTKGTEFTVKTTNGTITVLGTQFNVRAWGNNLLVECYEGKVEVRSGNQASVITANENVHIIAGKMQAKQSISNASPAWQQGVARFYADQLSVVCDELERQYDISVDLRAKDRTFTGSFKEGDLDKALRSICKPLGLNYTISPDKKSAVIE